MHLWPTLKLGQGVGRASSPASASPGRDAWAAKSFDLWTFASYFAPWRLGVRPIFSGQSFMGLRRTHKS